MSENTFSGMATEQPDMTQAARNLVGLAEKSTTVRVNFEVDRETHTKLKVFAAQQGRSVSDILRDSIASLASQ
jgi:hypothetical protein